MSVRQGKTIIERWVALMEVGPARAEHFRDLCDFVWDYGTEAERTEFEGLYGMIGAAGSNVERVITIALIVGIGTDILERTYLAVTRECPEYLDGYATIDDALGTLAERASA